MSSMYPPRGGQTIQSCMRCGLPLLPDMPVCRNCGWYNALPPQQFVGSIPMAPAQNQQAGYNGFASAQPGMYYALPATSTGAFQPAMNGFAPGNYYQQSQPLQPEPEQKQGPNVLAILLVIVSILLLIGSGCIAGYFFLFKNQGQNTVAITPTVPVIVTPSIKPLFGDNFQGNTNKWIISSVPGQYSVSIGGGQMVLEDDHNQLLWEIVPGQTFSDFRLDVDAKLTKGDKTNGYGIYIRGIATQNSDIGQFYRFELYGDGTFGLFKGTLDANNNTIATSLTGRDLISNTAIQTEGATNHITIIARGSSMQFIVNNTPVYTLNDSSYKGGQIALFVSNISTAPPVAQAAFTHLAIFPVN